MARGSDLSTPSGGGVDLPIPTVSEESVGRFAESVARFFGTGKFLIIQTVIVVVWILANLSIVWLRWDPYPFILLNLAFSTQAAYAAPLILLAQNRQEERDRAQTEQDREDAKRTQAETEYLTRELAAIRLALADVVTTEDIERIITRVLEARDADADVGKVDKRKVDKRKAKKSLRLAASDGD